MYLNHVVNIVNKIYKEQERIWEIIIKNGQILTLSNKRKVKNLNCLTLYCIYKLEPASWLGGGAKNSKKVKYSFFP